MADRRPPTTGEIVTLVSAAAILLASFLPLYEVSVFGVHSSWNAWSNAFLIFPLVLIMVILSVAIGVLVALRVFANAPLPPRLLGFTLVQLNVAVSLLVAVTLLCYFVRDTGLDKGAGLIVMLIAAIGMVVGAFMQNAQAQSAAGPWG